MFDLLATVKFLKNFKLMLFIYLISNMQTLRNSFIFQIQLKCTNFYSYFLFNEKVYFIRYKWGLNKALDFMLFRKPDL